MININAAINMLLTGYIFSGQIFLFVLIGTETFARAGRLQCNANTSLYFASRLPIRSDGLFLSSHNFFPFSDVLHILHVGASP